jgi:hypothetical protein
MPDSAHPRYGRVNTELARQWLSLGPERDGPFLAVNLMRYRPRAEYADGRATTLSGREADDAYTPLGPLEAVGASILLAADVAAQPAGEPCFHRVAIVRYPTRASFLAMQQREDFQELHVHKDAGMEFTIIFAAEPPDQVGASGSEDPLVMRLRRFAPGARPAGDPDGVSAVMALRLDGVMVGDERRWDDARIDRVAPAALDQLAATAGVEEQLLIVLATPMLDVLAQAVRSAATAG